MEITTGKIPLENGKVKVIVDYYEQIDGLGYSIEAGVWVEYTDSQEELNRRAKEAAAQFLRRAISAHDSGCPE